MKMIAIPASILVLSVLLIFIAIAAVPRMVEPDLTASRSLSQGSFVESSGIYRATDSVGSEAFDDGSPEKLGGMTAQDQPVAQETRSASSEVPLQSGDPISQTIGQPHTLPTPIPDGRIFTSPPSGQDAIPYIPTESALVGTKIPIVTSEPD